MRDKSGKWKQIGSIFWTFSKIAPITFGGGYAMIPVLEREAVHRKRWIRQEDIADVLAVAQTVPGAIALNAAALVGYRVSGIVGAVTAVIGMLLPTMLVVIGLAGLLERFGDHPKAAAALMGMKPAIIAMIVFAGIRTARTALVDKATIGLALAAVALLLVSISPLVVIGSGAAAGLLIGGWKQRQGIDTAPVRRYTEPDYFIGDGI